MTTSIAEASSSKQIKGKATRPVAARWYSEKRVIGLSRFAFAITLLNILGHSYLGFEQPWIVPFATLLTAYACDLLGETLESRSAGRSARFSGGWQQLIVFLLPAHITALAVGMLLFAADNLMAPVFAAVVAIGSKYLFKVNWTNADTGKLDTRHFLNPSNFGITITLLSFPTVGISPPYQFTENISGLADWILPCIIIATGTYLNSKATGKLPLICAWLTAFAAQALLRAYINGTPSFAGLVPMTGFAFILFTFYMITDPATTPVKTSNQVVFAVLVALLYALFMQMHIVFGMFYALALVSFMRGIALASLDYRAGRSNSIVFTKKVQVTR